MTFHTDTGMRFANGSTADFPGVIIEMDKLLTVQFSQILVTTTLPAETNFILTMDLPAGYEILPITILWSRG